MITNIVVMVCTMTRAAGRGQRGRVADVRLPGSTSAPPLNPELSSCHPLSEIRDLLRSVDFEHGVQNLLRGGLRSGSLVDLVRLELSQDIPKMVDPLLVQSLEGLENKWRL